ncbi:MAG TPA: hypothetical protein VH763_13375 [Gemmatimonadales bacterium]
MRWAPQVLLPLLMLLAAGPANSQTGSAALPDGPAPGGSVELFHYEDEGALTAFAFHLSRLQHNGLGLEVGLGMFPEYLQERALVMTPDVGVGYNISLPGVTFLLRGGAGAIAALGQGSPQFFPGIHLGGGALIQLDKRVALRADLLKRWYVLPEGTEPFWSLGVGFSVLAGGR